MKQETTVEYISDDRVDASLDQELRDLLSLCYAGRGDDVFKQRRYCSEPPKHRWMIRSPNGQLIGHVAVHEKAVESDGETFRIGGIAEVCVRPEFRRRGLVKIMLGTIHPWLTGRGFQFAMLFGAPEVYTSSGYVTVNNLFYDSETPTGEKGLIQATAMVEELTARPWPTGTVYLPGHSF